MRAATAAMLALLVAFSLQLDDPGWAGTSALIVAQPILGATLRKGVLRLIGTFIGAGAGVALFSCFPQDRVGFFLGLAGWAALCSAAATLLGDVVAYAPLLAGYTCAIVAIAAVSNPPDVFLLAVARGACIVIGIVSTSLVFALTDRGRQRGVLARLIETASGEAVAGLLSALRDPAPDLQAGQTARRTLVARVAALDAVVDQAVGENLDLRARAGVLRRAIVGLLVILSSWRGVEQFRRRTPDGATAAIAERLLHEAVGGESTADALRAAAARIDAENAPDVSRRLLLDRAVHAVEGLADVRSGLDLLRTPLHAQSVRGLPPTRLRDPASAAVNALRSFVTVMAAVLIWNATGWASGSTFVTFATVIVLLFGIKGEGAYSGAVTMAVGVAMGLVIATVVKFAAMPWAQGQGFDGFGGFCILLGGPVAVLGTIGAALPAGRPGSVIALTAMALFLALLSPTNEIAYDFAGFMDSGLAILAGSTLGAAAHRVMPALPRRVRVSLLLAATRRDLRRIADCAWTPDDEAWEARQYARSAAMPPDASLLDHGRLLAALAIGRELLRRRARPDMDEVRGRASDQQIEAAVASHPDYFGGLGLVGR